MSTLRNFMGLTLVVTCAGAWAADRAGDGTSTPPAVAGQERPDADNTGVNVRDRDGATQTPQKQSNAVIDRDLLAAVRRAIVDDDTLSTSGHNVKVIVDNGVVTLRGPVASADERDRIGTLAREIAGVMRVENELDVDSK